MYGSIVCSAGYQRRGSPSVYDDIEAMCSLIEDFQKIVFVPRCSRHFFPILTPYSCPSKSASAWMNFKCSTEGRFKLIQGRFETSRAHISVARRPACGGSFRLGAIAEHGVSSARVSRYLPWLPASQVRGCKYCCTYTEESVAMVKQDADGYER